MKAVFLNMNSRQTVRFFFFFPLECILCSSPRPHFPCNPCFLLPPGGRHRRLLRRQARGRLLCSPRNPQGDQRARLSIKLPGTGTAEAGLHAPDCAKCHMSDASSIFLFFYLQASCGSQILNVILSWKFFKNHDLVLCFLSLSLYGILKEGWKSTGISCKENRVETLLLA